MFSLTRQLTFSHIRSDFGFRSIEIGRWVQPHERDRAAERFHHALSDLLALLGGSSTMLSLRGSLGLQYGIGGRPGVSAHYRPATRQLSLAKNAGAGSLAHEWFHAFDHHVGPAAFGISSGAVFASRAWSLGGQPIEHPINESLSVCLAAILGQAGGGGETEYRRRSEATDRQIGERYFGEPEELCARAFEAYVQDRVAGNRFLVSGTRQSREAQLGLYPMGQERRLINEAFDGYFGQLGGALARKESVSE